MTSVLQWINAAAMLVVALCYVTFFAAFLLRRGSTPTRERRRARASLLGIVLQAAAFALVWMLQRPWLSPFLPLGAPVAFILPLAAMALAVWSRWFGLSAVRTLGRQWSFAARVVEGHRLVTEGPYALVRNPIYTAMLGTLLATILAVSHWVVLVPALVLYLAGTLVRVRSEEGLLRGEFGAAFEDYARRVPALFPRLRRGAPAA